MRSQTCTGNGLINMKDIFLSNTNLMTPEEVANIKVGLTERSLLREQLFGDKPINKETIEHLKKYISYGAESVMDLDKISQIDDPKARRAAENAWFNDYVIPTIKGGGVYYHIKGVADTHMPFVYMKDGTLTEATFTLEDIGKMGLAERVKRDQERQKVLKDMKKNPLKGRGGPAASLLVNPPLGIIHGLVEEKIKKETE